VFAIVDDPANFPKYVPNVHDVVDVRRSDGRIGDSFRVIYKVLGVTFDEKFTDLGRLSGDGAGNLALRGPLARTVARNDDRLPNVHLDGLSKPIVVTDADAIDQQQAASRNNERVCSGIGLHGRSIKRWRVVYLAHFKVAR